MTKYRIFKTLALATLPIVSHAGSNPWLPEPGALNGNVAYIYQTADKFFLGNKKSDLPTDLEQHTATFIAEYGFNDSIAFDAALGYSKTDFFETGAAGPAPFGASLDGMTDTNLGIRWRAFDELIDAPLTLTFRAAGIIEGDYRVGAINAIGDGASGGEFSTLVGKFFEMGLALSAEFGYRVRENPVPDSFFTNLQASYAVTSKLSVGANYQVLESLSGIDIGSPGFTFARFPNVNQDYQLLGGNISYQVTPRTSVTVNYLGTVDGRNTAYHDIVGVSLGYNFF